MKRKFIYIEAAKLRPSKILPRRELGKELEDSVNRDGVQQAIIVRPSPYEEGMYEIVDGHGRHESIPDNRKVLVDIRYGLSDPEVFRISEATFKRKRRNTYERAFFYGNWVETVQAKHGSRGAQKRVADMAGLSDAEISHYLSISRVFVKLGLHNIGISIFNVLKIQSVNKLYALSKVEDKEAMLEIAAKMAENPDMTLKELKKVVEETTSPSRKIIRELVEEDEEDEEDESARMDQLKIAAQELEGLIDKTRKTLAHFNTMIIEDPRAFTSADIFKKIRKIVNALKRVQKEASHVISSTKR